MPRVVSRLAAILVLTAATLAPDAAGQATKKPVPKLRPEQAPGYEPVVIEGFTVLFSKEAWRNKDDATYKITPHQAIEKELKTIVAILPAKTTTLLRNLLVWVEWDEVFKLSSGRTGNAVAVYYGAHQSHLLAKGMHPLKAKTVSVLSLKTLTRMHEPGQVRALSVLLHEMAHAVHDQLLTRDHVPVKTAFRQALERKLYDKETYLTTNEMEFFAELTCSYFDQLDYFPRTRAEFLKHDPVTYKTLEAIWGKNAKTPASSGGPAVTSRTIDAPKLPDLDWGKPISGPIVGPDEAKGKPTLVLYWNVADDSSFAALAKWNAWNNELRDIGLVAAAVHLTGKTAQDVKRAVVERDYLSLSVAEGRWTEDSIVPEFKDFPLCVMYGADGVCVFKGSPFEVEATMRSAVGAAVVSRAGLDAPPKGLETIVADLRKGKAPATLFARVSSVAKGKDEPSAEGAKLLIGHLTDAAQRRLEDLEPKIKTEPVEAFFAIERIAVAYKDTPVGAAAAAHHAKLQYHKSVAFELRARTSLANVKKLETALSGKAGSFDPSQPRFRRDNAAALAQLEAAIRQLRTAYPNTRAAEQAERIAQRFEVR